MKTRNGRPKLPVKQLAILAVARFAEPLALTSVFPYLPEMIASFGVEKKDIAKWAGATSAVFSLAQGATAVFWGRTSDRIGRKPTVILGLFFTMTFFLIWGVSTSLPMAIAIRAIQGASNGNVGIIRTMVAEMVPEKELQPRAFSIMPLVWSIGSIFGPAFGGLFAKPAERFPGLFGGSRFLQAYPFALPNIMGAIIFLISLTTALLFLRETLARRRDAPDWGIALGERIGDLLSGRHHSDSQHHHGRRLRRYSILDDEAAAPLLAEHRRQQSPSPAPSTGGTTPVADVDPERETPSPHKSQPLIEKQAAAPSMRAVFTRQSVINLVAYTFLALHSVAYDQVLPVFLNYPERGSLDGPAADESGGPIFFTGGFGLDSGSIGTIFMLYGVVCGLVQFLLFPPLCARFGVLRCFRGCALAFPLVYIVTPYTGQMGGGWVRYAALVVVMSVKAFAVIVGFPCTTILLTNSARSLSVLGTLNGFATTFSAFGRAIGPAIAGAAFSFGVKHTFIALPWWLLASMALLGAIPVWFIEEGEGPSAGAGAADDDGDQESETEVEDDEELNEDGDASEYGVVRAQPDGAIIAGDAPDAVGVAEDEIIAEPAAQDDLPLVGSLGASKGGYGALGRR